MTTVSYEKIELERLYNNRASIRDYVWKRLLKERKGIEFVCKGLKKKVSWHNLIKGEMNKRQKFESKFDGKVYYLIDFLWSKEYEK